MHVAMRRWPGKEARSFSGQRTACCPCTPLGGVGVDRSVAAGDGELFHCLAVPSGLSQEPL